MSGDHNFHEIFLPEHSGCTWLSLLVGIVDLLSEKRVMKPFSDDDVK